MWHLVQKHRVQGSNRMWASPFVIFFYFNLFPPSECIFLVWLHLLHSWKHGKCSGEELCLGACVLEQQDPSCSRPLWDHPTFFPASSVSSTAVFYLIWYLPLLATEQFANTSCSPIGGWNLWFNSKDRWSTDSTSSLDWDHLGVYPCLPCLVLGSWPLFLNSNVLGFEVEGWSTVRHKSRCADE